MIKLKKLVQSSDGMTFKDAIKWALDHNYTNKQKIAYGTKSNKFHIINSNDRDFKTALLPNQFLKYKNQKQVIQILTSPSIV